MKDQLEKKAHVIMLGVGLLNVAVLPLWRFSLAKATTQAVGYPLFGLGLALFLLSLLALERGFGGEIEPVTELVTGGIYAWLRHPMYISFAIKPCWGSISYSEAPWAFCSFSSPSCPAWSGEQAWTNRPWPSASARRGRIM